MRGDTTGGNGVMADGVGMIPILSLNDTTMPHHNGSTDTNRLTPHPVQCGTGTCAATLLQ